jgi:hypothetical protein
MFFEMGEQAVIARPLLEVLFPKLIKALIKLRATKLRERLRMF